MNNRQAFGITLTAKLKHAALYAAAKKLGGQSALARHLDVSVSRVGDWCNLKACPPVSLDTARPGQRKFWTRQRLLDIETKLYELTGQTLDELFPDELRNNVAFLESPKQIEATEYVQVAALANATVDRLTLPDPSVVAEQNEQAEHLSRTLKTLTYREREIIKLRFGLGGGHTYTLEEVGHIFKVTQERIRGIEAKALHKLQQPARAQKLVGLVD